MKNFIKKNPPRFFLLVVLTVCSIIVLGLLAMLALKKDVSKDVIAVVGDEKITESDRVLAAKRLDFSNSDYENLKPGVKEQLDLQLIIDAIVRQEAKRLNITVSDEEIKNDIDRNKDEQSGWVYESFNKEQQQLIWEGTRSKILRNKVIDASVSRKKGYYLNFNFHKYIADESYKIPGNGDPAKIAEHKTYAKNLAEKTVQDFRARKITFEQAKDILIKDPIIGEEALKPRTPNIWMEFTKEEYMQNERIFQKEVFKKAAQNLKSGEVSNPIADKGVFNKKEEEYRYVVIFVTESNGGQYETYSQWKEAKIAEYVKTNNLVSFLKKISSKTYAAPDICKNVCNADNADILVRLYFRNADNNGYTRLGGESVTIVSGSTTDPAAAKSDGGNCNSPERHTELNLTTRTSDAAAQGGVVLHTGEANLCNADQVGLRYDYSYYCSTQSRVVLRINSRGTIRTGDVGSGTWYWERVNEEGENWSNDGLMKGNRSAWNTNESYNDASATARENGPGPNYDWSGTDDADDSRVALIDKEPRGDGKYEIRISLSASWTNNSTAYNGDSVKNYFVWRPNYRTLSYDANGATSGSVPSPHAGRVGGERFNLRNNTGNLAKTGYTFGGWNTKEDGTGTNYAEGALYTMPDKNTTLYAKWNAVSVDQPSCVIIETGTNSIASLTPITVSFRAEKFLSVDNWDFGAAGTAAGVTTTKKTFVNAGTYNVSVTGKDLSNVTQTAYCTVTVYPEQNRQGNEVKP